MRYEILGKVRVEHAGEHRYVNAPKVELLLRVLLIEADKYLTSDQLINEIWGEQSPRRAKAGLHVYISQIRKFLEQPRETESLLRTRNAPLGYCLRLHDGEVDYRVWNGHLRSAWSAFAARDHLLASQHCARALALWRELPEAPASRGPIMEGFLASLVESRLEALELSISSAIMLGRDRTVVNQLHSLIAEHPLRECFYLQLMIALYRMDRQADALAVYQQAWRTLDRELGIGPGQSLRQLHQSILMEEDHPELVLTKSFERTCA
ncbi:AfsR/SARP family transcriptional regulator [Streptomyces sparsogenes]|uniref:AfsR/SARP family transcriptional regulator n=1 Tax=Streptomyces sparsogenes TaxID=67365 RepID=UPI0033FEFEFE